VTPTGHDAVTDDHRWAQGHLSHYVDGELSPRSRRRLDRHARGCADCGLGIRAMRALVYSVQGLGGPRGVRAPASIFDRVRMAVAADGNEASQDPAEPA
jgi:anti-sigma factor RsiW